MKSTIIIIALWVLSMSFTKQSDNALLYQQTLLNHLPNAATDTVFILKCFDIEIPAKIGRHAIVDVSDNASSFIDKNSSLYAVKLMPIELRKGVIEITLVDYVLKNNAGEITMSNTGSVVFSYTYDNQNKRYRLLKKSKNTF